MTELLYSIVHILIYCIETAIDDINGKVGSSGFTRLLKDNVSTDLLNHFKKCFDRAEDKIAQSVSSMPKALATTLFLLMDYAKLAMATLESLKASYQIEEFQFHNFHYFILLELSVFGEDVGSSWTFVAFQKRIFEAITIIVKYFPDIYYNGICPDKPLTRGQLKSAYFQCLKEEKGFLNKKFPLVQQFVQQADAKSKVTETMSKPKPKPKQKPRPKQKSKSKENQRTAPKKRDNSCKATTAIEVDSIDHSSGEPAEDNPWNDKVKIGKLLAESPCTPLQAGSSPEPAVDLVVEDVEREPPYFLEQFVLKIDRAPEVDLRDIAFSYVLIGERIYRKRLLPIINQLGCRHVFRRSMKELEQWLIALKKSEPTHYQELGLDDEEIKLCLKWYGKRLDVCHPQIYQNAAKRKALLTKLYCSIIEADSEMEERIAGCLELAKPAKKFSKLPAPDSRPEQLLSPAHTEAYISILFLQEAFDCEQLVELRNSIAHTFLSKDRYLAYINYLYPTHKDKAFLLSFAEL